MDTMDMVVDAVIPKDICSHNRKALQYHHQQPYQLTQEMTTNGKTGDSLHFMYENTGSEAKKVVQDHATLESSDTFPIMFPPQSANKRITFHFFLTKGDISKDSL